MKIITCTTPLLEQNMYIVEEGKHCIVIDPYYDEKTAVLLEGKIVDLLLVTHEHYDHISGVNKFKELYGCKLLSNSKCDNNLQRPAKNFSKYFEAYYEFQADLQKPDFAFDSNYSCSADELFNDSITFRWQHNTVFIKMVPGHSEGGNFIFLNENILFSGDILLDESVPAAKFPGGSPKEFTDVALPYINTLPPELVVYPGPAGPFVPENEFLLSRVKESPLLPMSDLFDQIWQGSMPALNSASEQDWNCYYSSYVQTFLQRDVKELAQVNDELQFYRFLCAAASYTGSMLNYAALAKEVEITPPTAKQWLKVLAAAGLVYFLEPFAHPNLKYAVKAPKLYFTDTGLAAYLLRWSSAATLEAGAMASNFFETWVVNEIYKSFINCGQIPPLSYFRDFNTKEVELLIETDGCVYPLAIRKSAQPVKEIKKFEILKPIAEGEKALRIGSGGVVCLANDLLPVDAKNWYIPVGLL